MSILKVSRMGHPVLRRVADPVTEEQIASDEIQRLVADMHETMAAYQGVGLAAPQVHVSLRLLVYRRLGDEEAEDEVLTLINPQIEPSSEERASAWEGCLSIPDMKGVVSRYRQIRVSALDAEGGAVALDALGFEARVIQHEVDHLDGILYFDRMTDLRSLSFLEEYETFWAGDQEEDVE